MIDKIKRFFIGIFHKRISRLHPVVLFDENCSLQYGRYVAFNKYDKSGNPHNVILESGDIVLGFAVRRLTENEYAAILNREGKHDRANYIL